MWVVIGATAALVAALIAIAVLGRRRDLANMGPPKGLSNSRNGGAGTNGSKHRPRPQGGTGVNGPRTHPKARH